MPALVPLVAAPLDTTTTATSHLYSADLGTPVRLPGASMPVGKRFFVIAQASYGGTANNTVPEIICLNGRVAGARRLQGDGEGNDRGVPEAQRISHLAGFWMHEGNGVDIEFAYKSYSGVPVWFKSSCPLVGIPMNQTGAELVENTDYWFVQEDVTSYAAPLAQTANSWVDVQTLNVTIATSGAYQIFAMFEATGEAVAEQRLGRCSLNGILIKNNWGKESEDIRDEHPFVCLKQVFLTSGNHTITLEGSGTGVGVKSFWRGRIYLFRCGAFQQMVNDELGGYVVIEHEYPSYTPILIPSYAPQQSETVVFVANSFPYRTNDGSLLTRIRDATSDSVLSEFCSDVNIAFIDQDRMSHMSVGVATFADTRIISYEAAGETGLGVSASTTRVLNPSMLLWSMNLAGAGGGPDYTATPSESFTMSEVLVNQPAAIVGESLALSEALPLETISSPTPIEFLNFSEVVNAYVQTPSQGVPQEHPRLYLTPTKLAQLQLDAANNTTFWQSCVNAGSKDAWQWALMYMATGTATYKTNAMNAIEAIIVAAEANFNLGDSSYLNYRDYMRTVALPLDWLWNELPDATRNRWMDFLDAATYVCWNETSEANSIYNDSDWATTDPTQNYYPQKLCGTTYVALATYWERRPTFTWLGVPHTFQLELNSNGSGPWYTNIWDFVRAKVETQGDPDWDEYCEGGGWLEGANYSRAAKRSLSEMFWMWKHCAGIDRFSDPIHDWMRETVLFTYFYHQPGYTCLHPDGDISAGNTKGTRNDYDRIMMLLLGAGLIGTIEGQYAQHYLKNIYTSITPGHSSSSNIVWDFFMYDPALPARDPALDLPPYYYASGCGYIASRSAWSSTAFQLSMLCVDNFRGHKHHDQGSVNFYQGKSGGTDDFMCSESQPFTIGSNGTGLNASHYHNVYLMGGHQQRKNASQNLYGPVGTIPRKHLTTLYTYARMDISDAYWTNFSSSNWHGDEKMNDYLHREVFHVRTGNYVVVYDRVTMTDAFVGTTSTQRWHFPKVQPTINGSEFKSDNGTNRLFMRSLYPSSATFTWTDEEGASSTDTWLLEIDVPLTKSREFLNAFMATTTATSAMPTTTVITSNNAQMRGVHIIDATTESLVLFSTLIDGAAPGQFSYSYEESAQPCNHYVTCLKPNVGYNILTSESGGTRSITIAETGPFYANSAGVLQFDPGDLVPFSGIFTTVNEGPILFSESLQCRPYTEPTETLALSEVVTPTAIAILNETVVESLSVTESVVSAPNPMPVEAVAIAESVTAKPGGIPAEALGFTETVQVWISAPIPPEPQPIPGTSRLIDRSVEFDSDLDKGVTF